MFEMKDEFLLGVDMIDEEHRKLFDIAKRAYDLMNDEFVSDKFDYVVEILNELTDYTIEHFADEEAYMAEIGYKRIFSHKIEHKEFIDKLHSLDFSSIEENPDQVIFGILNYLNDWLVNHILYTDKLIVKE